MCERASKHSQTPRILPRPPVLKFLDPPLGETSNTLRARVRLHKQHINSREYRQINLYANLETCGKITIQKQCLFSHSISLEMSVLSIDEK